MGLCLKAACVCVYGNNNEAGWADAGQTKVFAYLFLWPTAHVTLPATFLHHMVVSAAGDSFFFHPQAVCYELR